MQPKPETLDLIRRLVSMPTVSRDSNLDLIRFVTDLLDEQGVAYKLFFNDERTKANLLATLGPTDVPGIILSGHTDVVPTDGQAWSRDPFDPWVADGKLYGRGTCDMKGFIGCVLSRIGELQARGLKEPIHIALSYDEEVGCSGCTSMIAHVAELETRPRACIVGEPTEMGVVNAHKGIHAYETRIHGKPAHSSTPAYGANALVAAARLVAFLDDLNVEFASRDWGEGALRFDPPYTTNNVGTLTGGNAINIIPEDAHFVWEYRSLPDSNVREIIDRFNAHVDEVILPQLQSTFPDAWVQTTELSAAPPLIATGDNSAEALVLALAQSNETGAVSYATEAGHFQATAQVPTVVCGPGSIDQAHREDEFIALSELAACEQFLDRLLDLVCRD